MKPSHIIKELNMSSGEVLTLDKAADRIEFEALPSIQDLRGICNPFCGGDCTCNGMKCGSNTQPAPQK